MNYKERLKAGGTTEQHYKDAAAHAAKPSSGTNSPDLDKVMARKAMRDFKPVSLADQMKIHPNMPLLTEDQQRQDHERFLSSRGHMKGGNSGGGGGGDQPRVPAGSSDGGQWTKG